MAHTHSQDLETCFNTLQSDFLETQKEVKQLSATVASIDSSINTTINTTMQSSMEEVKHETNKVRSHKINPKISGI
jgi:uncharacterized protein YlxW (UPF0749 family)